MHNRNYRQHNHNHLGDSPQESSTQESSTQESSTQESSTQESSTQESSHNCDSFAQNNLTESDEQLWDDYVSALADPQTQLPYLRQATGLHSGHYALYEYLCTLSAQYGTCQPTNKHLAQHFHLSRRQLSRWIDRLQRQGYIALDYDHTSTRTITLLAPIVEHVEHSESTRDSDECSEEGCVYTGGWGVDTSMESSGVSPPITVQDVHPPPEAQDSTNSIYIYTSFQTPKRSKNEAEVTSELDGIWAQTLEDATAEPCSKPTEEGREPNSDAGATGIGETIPTPTPTPSIARTPPPISDIPKGIASADLQEGSTPLKGAYAELYSRLKAQYLQQGDTSGAETGELDTASVIVLPKPDEYQSKDKEYKELYVLSWAEFVLHHWEHAGLQAPNMADHLRYTVRILASELKRSHISKLEAYSRDGTHLEAVATAINNYARVLLDEQSYYTHRYDPWTFVYRKMGSFLQSADYRSGNMDEYF